MTLIVYAISITGILANTLITPVLPEIKNHFNLDSGEAGLMVSLASVPGVVVAPLLGLVSDRIGRRATVIPCLIVFGVGGLLGMVAPSYTLLLMARLVQGFGAAGLINLAIVILGDRHEGATRSGERARAIGRNAAAITLGLAVLPALGGLLGDIGGWRASFAPYVLAFAVAVMAARVLPRDVPVENAPPLRATLKEALPYLRDRRVAVMAPVGFVLFILVFGLVLTALPLFLDEQFGIGATARGLILGAPATASVIVALAIGRLSGRFDTWSLVMTGLALFVASFLVLSGATALVVVVLAALIYGLGEGLTIVPLQTYSTTIAPAAYRGVVVGVWVASVRAGQSVGPWLAGRVLEWNSFSKVFLGGAVLAGTLFLAVLSATRLLLTNHRFSNSGG